MLGQGIGLHPYFCQFLESFENLKDFNLYNIWQRRTIKEFSQAAIKCRMKCEGCRTQEQTKKRGPNRNEAETRWQISGRVDRTQNNYHT